MDVFHGLYVTAKYYEEGKGSFSSFPHDISCIILVWVLSCPCGLKLGYITQGPLLPSIAGGVVIILQRYGGFGCKQLKARSRQVNSGMRSPAHESMQALMASVLDQSEEGPTGWHPGRSA
ncbi:uncharacterized protein VTP21DRAFT_7002 [Calcarisporiella thermophila]|uniref:uncharacterized protein n=1 Tax=Calcarisporiella thermophila TaxID=911321 RepID=UPI0037421942